VLAPVDTEFMVMKIVANPDIKRHLEDLGIIAGSKIKLISNSGGNVICEIKDGRVALDTETARKIFVA
ncbi:MAG: ferrous iron transport protein A, partial [Clostridia bacterium]|nr:ferrous iron transport protein A [Clostridia bacterium]